jgi:hypothetical protein
MNTTNENEETPLEENNNSLEIQKKHKISWSQYRLWKNCPHKHWLIYREDEPRDPPSKFTDYGTCIHNTAEDWFREIQSGLVPDFDIPHRFLMHFMNIAMPNQLNKVYSPLQAFKKDELAEWVRAGKESCIELIQFIENKYLKNGWEVFSPEHDLLTPLDEEHHKDYYFNGFVDLILRKGDKFKILDYKSCSWGWGKDKTSDPNVIGQVQAYAHFFFKQHPELVKDIENIETSYILVKRTVSTGFRIEELGVQVTDSVIEEILNNFRNMIDHLEKGTHPYWGTINGECSSYGGCKFAGTPKCKFGRK